MEHRSLHRAFTSTSLRCAVAAACLALPLAAHADQVIANASAQITQLSYTLIDLDPNDGITPGASFGSNSLRLTADNDDKIDTFSGLMPTSALSNRISNMEANAGPLGYATSVSMPMSNVAERFDPSRPGYQVVNVLDRATTTLSLAWQEGAPLSQILLTPKTLMVITGVAHISGSFDTDALNAGLKNLPNVVADSTFVQGDSSITSWVQIQLGQTTYTGDDTVTQESGAASFFNLGSFQVPAYDHSSAFSLQFANVGAESTELQFLVDAHSEIAFSAGATFAPPIPEPGTCALMGLGFVGVAMARRRHSAN